MDYVNFLAGIQAMLAAISVWQAERSYELATKEFERVSERVRADPATRDAARRLEGVLPPKIAQTLFDNVEVCWNTFNECITGQSDEDSLLDCEAANRKCICANLRALVRNNGCLPHDLRELWIQFGCGPVPPICQA